VPFPEDHIFSQTVSGRPKSEVRAGVRVRCRDRPPRQGNELPCRARPWVHAGRCRLSMRDTTAPALYTIGCWVLGLLYLPSAHVLQALQGPPVNTGAAAAGGEASWRGGVPLHRGQAEHPRKGACVPCFRFRSDDSFMASEERTGQRAALSYTATATGRVAATTLRKHLARMQSGDAPPWGAGQQAARAEKVAAVPRGLGLQHARGADPRGCRPPDHAAQQGDILAADVGVDVLARC